MKNRFFDTESCVDRLYREYKKHPRLIIACDFDDTIFGYHNKDDDHSDVINLLKECSELNFYIVIFSASSQDRFDFMIKYAESMGIKVCAAVNKNAIELPYGHWGKIYYNILLDDRAGLKNAYETLRILIDKIKNKNRYSDSAKG